MFKKLLSIVTVSLFCINAFSQNIVKFEQLQKSSLANTNKDYATVEKLITNLQPKLYLIDGKEKNTSKTDINFCEVDVKAFNSLFNRNDLSKLEIITLKVNQNEQPYIDVKLLQSKFSQLKYLYLVYEYEISESLILKNIHNVSDNFLIVYSASIPN